MRGRILAAQNWQRTTLTLTRGPLTVMTWNLSIQLILRGLNSTLWDREASSVTHVGLCMTPYMRGIHVFPSVQREITSPPKFLPIPPPPPPPPRGSATHKTIDTCNHHLIRESHAETLRRGAKLMKLPFYSSASKSSGIVHLIDSHFCRYHLFFQNVPDSIEWKFGIVWGHVSSKDLVYWQHHPPALEPGKISPEKEGFFKWDADGCFTGCAAITPDGKPTILYTGISA